MVQNSPPPCGEHPGAWAEILAVMAGNITGDPPILVTVMVRDCVFAEIYRGVTDDGDRAGTTTVILAWVKASPGLLV